MCPRTHCSCRKHSNFFCHRVWSCWNTCSTYYYPLWKPQTALKYTDEQQPFSSSKSGLAFTEKQQPWITVYFVIFGFLAFFLITYVPNICRWLFYIFIFILASKQAKCDNREQEAAIREKKRYAKRISKWKVFNDNRMGNQVEVEEV